MRVDKVLWFVRMFKSRSLASEACRQGKVRIGESVIKPSREVFPGDKLMVRKNQINYELEILDLPKSRLGAKLVDLYVRDLTPKEEFEKLDLLKYSRDYYRKKGSGRPTKKDRRELDEWFDTPEDEISEVKKESSSSDIGNTESNERTSS